MNNTQESLNKISIVPIGGCGEFGKNMTCFIYKKKLFMVDAGLLFPEPYQLGVAGIIPDINSFVENNGGSVSAYLITHGHEDHIGGLSHIYKEWPAPIFATPWTAYLIRKKFLEARILDYKLQEVQDKEKVVLHGLSAEYIHVNHSIPNTCSLLIRAGKMSIFHTGDFKFDKTGLYEKPIDLKYIKRLGEKEKITLLLADSTNAHKEGFSPDEETLIKPLKKIIQQAPSRIFLTTFSSNLWRLITIVKICEDLKRKLVIAGRGMRNCLEQAEQLGIYKLPKYLLLDERQLSNHKNQKIVFLVSGSQGEYLSTLWRIANQQHKNIKVKKDDTFVFSSRLIPGNEKNSLVIQDALKKQGATIIAGEKHGNIHVSGHAFRGELATMLKLLNPRFYIPIHGTHGQLERNTTVCEENRNLPQKILLTENGQSLELTHNNCKLIKNINFEKRFIDKESLLPMEARVLNERLKIGESGLIIISGVINLESKIWMKGPHLKSQGVPGLDIQKKSCKETLSQIESEIRKYSENLLVTFERSNQEKFEESIRLFTRDTICRHVFKRPICLVNVWLLRSMSHP